MSLNKHLHRMWITSADIFGINNLSRCLGLLFVGVTLNFGALAVALAATDCSVVTEISQSQCETLIEFYNSTNGDNWENNDGWNSTITPCS